MRIREVRKRRVREREVREKENCIAVPVGTHGLGRELLGCKESLQA